MTRLKSITPGVKERISATVSRLLAGAGVLDAIDNDDITNAFEAAIRIENRLTALCRPEAKGAK